MTGKPERSPRLRIADVWRGAAGKLKSSGIETPDLDARLLLAHAAGMADAGVLTALDATLEPETADHYDALIARRRAGEPVSRIIGRRGFWKHDFIVTPDTLDPRPDSETLVELVLRIVAHEGWEQKEVSLLDIGTGTGCLLLCLLDELPRARGTATDISGKALAVARENAGRLRVTDRATFRKCRWTEGLAGPFDIILSNPPYIPSGDINGLMDEVRNHDPHIALDGGADGLDACRAIASGAAALQSGGWLVLEIGAAQHNDVAQILNGSGYDVAVPGFGFTCDLSGTIRCVAGRKK
ncbi:MAG: peptide chain release factor N(5)-glutamine methyltransferase [Hyphomicrobiaceae bacterium]